MEQIFTLQPGTNRPIIKLDDIFPGCTALIDTGAVFPVWTKDFKLLEGLGAKLYKRDIPFGGFGGITKGDVYKFTLTLGNIVFPEMQIMACHNDNIPGFFLFSATMFNKLNYTIDNQNKKLILSTWDNQCSFNLTIIDEKGNLHVMVTQ